MRASRACVVARAVAAGLSIVLAAAGVWAGQRVVSFDDLMALKAVATPAMSPDGAWVLYAVRQWEPAGREGEQAERREARSHIWRASTGADPAPRQLTFSPRGETAPAWSPDGRSISFLSARDGGAASGAEGDGQPRPEIWIMRADGGEAWKLTDAREGVQAYAWSPDGRWIAYTAREPLSSEQEARRRRRDDAQVVEVDVRRVGLWIVEVESKRAEPLPIEAGWSVRGGLSWAPDSTRLAFVAAPTPLVRDEREDVFVATLEPKRVEKITTNLGPDRAPAWSPDGRTIAYVAERTGRPLGDGIPIQQIGNARLMLYDVASGRTTEADSEGFDLSVGPPVWTRDSRRILFVTGAGVYRDLFAYDMAGRRFVQLTRGRVLTLGGLSRDGSRAAFLLESPTAPADVYVADPDFTTPRRVTLVNPQIAELALGETEVLSWRTDDGWTIQGILLKPVGYEQGRRYPLLVVVHGGPTSAFVNGFRASPGDPGQHWAGQGWAVLYPNPRGSTNYGEHFMRGNVPDWGGGDYRDIMAGVDAVIARGIADPDKLAVMGWSYGGYLTGWIVSQTARFKAAMMGAGLSNLWSMYGTNDIPNYLAAFFEGPPSSETLPRYLERSPLRYVDRVTTPLLILHGAEDERVPPGQGMELFRALKDRGKTVELVLYPREGHGLSEYYHQLDRLRRQFEWISRFTLGKRATSQ
jgi:dipeptidyl aminopeptidase/acylaminoacyl peptidase